MEEYRTYTIKIAAFNIKIATFNTIGFCIATGGPTYIDSILKTRVGYPQIEYPLGYWILLGAPILFAFTYWYLSWSKVWQLKAFVPGIVLLAAGILSLPNFQPQFPHSNVVIWTFLYAFVSVITGLIHYVPPPDYNISDASIHVSARIERVKESALMWRAFLLTVIVAYLALLVPWHNHFFEAVPRWLTDKKEQIFMRTMITMALACFSLYVAFGPLYEAFVRARRTPDELLKIKVESQEAE